MGRAGLAAAIAGVAAVFVGPAPALAQYDVDFPETEITATAGETWTGTASVPGAIPPYCDDIRNVSVYWGDGTDDAPATSATLVEETLGVNLWARPRVTASHVFPLDIGEAATPTPPYTVAAEVSYTVTCTIPCNPAVVNPECGIPKDGDVIGAPWLIAHVLPPGSSGSCPGHTASFVRSRQPSCPIYYTPALGKAQKQIFRQLARLAYRDYVVAKAIDDVVSLPGTVVSEGFFGKNWAADLAIAYFWDKYLERLVATWGGKKAIPWVWILDVPQYASYLAYVKYLVATKLADDPPDPNFTALASPPKLPRLRGAPRQIGERDRREAGLYIALLTTVERAAGAQLAGATTAQSKQLRHASDIADKLVRLLGTEQKALKAASRVVKRIHTGRLPRRVVRRTKRRLDPGSLTPALRKLGFTRDEIADVRQSAPSVPLKSLTAPSAKVLALGAEAKTVGALRTALASFAKRHAAGR